MSLQRGNGQDRKRYIQNLTLVGLVGQVGCVTLIIILIALFFGLWLDSRFATRPVITLAMLIGSVPVSLGVMFWLARKAVARLKPDLPEKQTSHKEEEFGNDS